MMSSENAEVERDLKVEESKRENSAESLSSTIFPWRKISARRIFVSRYETGRQIEPSGFYLCLLAVLLLCSGTFLVSACLWTMFSKLSYISILNQSLVTDPNNFNLCGGLLAIPCFWIAFTTHDNRKNYLLLPLLIVLLSISMTLLAVGSSITIIQRTKMSFSNCTDPPTLLPSQYKSLLIDTLKAGMDQYESNYNYKISWDRVQIRLQCCGVSGYRDWKSPPKSCYHNQTTHNGMFERGCLDGIAFEMSWHMCFLSGCALIALGIQMTTLVFVFYLYLKEKLGRATDVTSF